MDGIEVRDDGLVFSPALHDAVLVHASIGPPLELIFRAQDVCYRLTAPEDSLLWFSGLSLGGIVSQVYAFANIDALARIVSQASNELSVGSLMRSIHVMQLRPCGLFFLMNYLDDAVLFVEDVSAIRWRSEPVV